jgi:hypothetical protein
VTSTVKNTTPAAVVMAVHMTSSVNGKRMSTVLGGRWSFLRNNCHCLFWKMGAILKA